MGDVSAVPDSGNNVRLGLCKIQTGGRREDRVPGHSLGRRGAQIVVAKDAEVAEGTQEVCSFRRTDQVQNRRLFKAMRARRPMAGRPGINRPEIVCSPDRRPGDVQRVIRVERIDLDIPDPMTQCSRGPSPIEVRRGGAVSNGSRPDRAPVCPPSVVRKISSPGHHLSRVVTITVPGWEGSTASPAQPNSPVIGGVILVHVPVAVSSFQTSPL